ncbi:heterokaryon incompatibility protein-domain-containing protein [Apodospora peruviana]|uniref:Heterokaryon incompatibility protein-domain-containing protein n=1 Tax=Apodospora peruviana TaxID=516989 RepID=A0AAE0IB54_9PEZI|nr:heterokaryon incompatibility protein-domain-containing protein [Apodospora peruviana]
MSGSTLCTRCQAVLEAISTAMRHPIVVEHLFFSTDEEEYFHYNSKRRCQLCKFWACQIGQIMAKIDAVAQRRGLLTFIPRINTKNAPTLAFPPLKDNTINTDLVKHWIDTCQSQHPGCHLPRNTKLPTGSRLIDYQLNKVAKAPEPTPPYLALSYVWGTAHVTETVDEGDPLANNQAPKTIRDAVTFTHQLGFRYLWVDRYYIDQADEDDKLDQINRMGDIYECLPGVGGGARTVPQTARTEGDDFIAIKLADLRFLYRVNYMRTAIPNSRWASRGWPYQEGLLSRRRLVFTEHHGNFLYFQCRKLSALEPIGLDGFDGEDLGSDFFPSIQADSDMY